MTAEEQGRKKYVLLYTEKKICGYKKEVTNAKKCMEYKNIYQDCDRG